MITWAIADHELRIYDSGHLVAVIEGAKFHRLLADLAVDLRKRIDGS